MALLKIKKIRSNKIRLWNVDVVEGFHVSSDAKRIAAAEGAQATLKLHVACVVHVAYVSLHVGLVVTLVRAVRAGELALSHFRIAHPTAGLDVPL